MQNYQAPCLLSCWLFSNSCAPCASNLQLEFATSDVLMMLQGDAGPVSIQRSALIRCPEVVFGNPELFFLLQVTASPLPSAMHHGLLLETPFGSAWEFWSPNSLA